MLDYACTEKSTQVITDLDKACAFWIWRQYLAAKEPQAVKDTLNWLQKQSRLIKKLRNGLRK